MDQVDNLAWVTWDALDLEQVESPKDGPNVRGQSGSGTDGIGVVGV